MKHSRLLAFGGFALLSVAAQATTLSFVGTCDNYMEAYLSLSPDSYSDSPWAYDADGTWTTLVYGNVNLIAGQTNYIHILAQDFGPPASFIAGLTLSDTDFWFEDGGQACVTGDSNWSVTLNAPGASGTAATIKDLGPNGTNLGFWNDIPSTAHYVWSNEGGQADLRYFTLKLNTVPEPATLSMLGVVTLLGLRRKRS